MVLYTWKRLVPAFESGSEGYPVSIEPITAEFALHSTSHSTDQTRADRLAFHAHLGWRMCLHHAPPDLMEKDSRDAATAVRFQLKGHRLFPVRSAATLSVPDNAGLMVALCLIPEPADPLKLLLDNNSVTCVPLITRPIRKMGFMFKKNLLLCQKYIFNQTVLVLTPLSSVSTNSSCSGLAQKHANKVLLYRFHLTGSNTSMNHVN